MISIRQHRALAQQLPSAQSRANQAATGADAKKDQKEKSPAPDKSQGSDDDIYTVKGPGGSVPYENRPDDDGDIYTVKGPGGSNPYPPAIDADDQVILSGK